MDTKQEIKQRPEKFELWLGIDPGQTHSGVVLLRNPLNAERFCEYSDLFENNRLLDYIKSAILTMEAGAIVIEDIAPTMVPLGHALADTLRWIGRFHERSLMCNESRVETKCRVELITRPKVRAILGVKDDAGTRQMVLSMFRPCGGGNVPQVGVKKRPGPLYGVTGHAWQAMAVLMAYYYQTQRGGAA